MAALALRSLWARKRMFAGAFSAVVLGVAFLAGALALGDTLTANFSKLFTNADAGTSAVVRSVTAVGSGIKASRPPIPASLLTTVRGVPGVADAQPSITGYGQLIGSDGKAVGGNGPPRTAANWITDPALNPYRIVRGRAPRSPPASRTEGSQDLQEGRTSACLDLHGRLCAMADPVRRGGRPAARG